jgi:hypothetical protein
VKSSNAARQLRPDVSAGDRIELKKPHPCGSTDWKVKSAGVSIELECCGCGRIILLSKAALSRRARSFTKPDPGGSTAS